MAMSGICTSRYSLQHKNKIRKIMAVEGSVREKKVKWLPGEVDALIAIWGEPDIAESIEKKTTKKKAVWELLATRLHDLGYDEVKSADAIKNKIFKIKQHYKKVDAQVGPSGAGSSILQEAPWYYKVHDILKQRPAMQAPPGSIDFGDLDENVKNSGSVDGASLLNTNGRPGDHQIQRLSSDEEFDDEGSQEMQNHPLIDAGWISDEDEVECEEPRAKLKCKANLRLHPSILKRERTGNRKKDESMKHMVKMLMENNMHRDKVLMEAEDAHRRMEAERHTEEIRLLRDQIQLERDRLQFEREERERTELIRREEAARTERLRREEMGRTEKARLDERDREERRFTLMMALIKGAQNHSN